MLQVLGRPYTLTQHVQFSDTSADLSTNAALLHAPTLQDTLTYMNSGGQRLPAEAIPPDRLSPLCPLSRSQTSHAITGAGSNNSLKDSPRNFSNEFEFEFGQGPLREPQSSEFMPSVDQDKLSVFPTRVSHKADSDSSVDTTRENSIYLRNSRTIVTLEANRPNLLVQICQNLMIIDRDCHLGIIKRKSFKTKYRLKRAVFQ